MCLSRLQKPEDLPNLKIEPKQEPKTQNTPDTQTQNSKLAEEEKPKGWLAQRKSSAKVNTCFDPELKSI